MARRGGNARGDPDGPQISAEERSRIAKAARQVTAYANFLRWTANFQKDEVAQHPRHERVLLLSPMQSGRFAFCVQGDTIYLGVQPFEAVWMATLPLDKAHVSDRLYLSIEGIACMDCRLPPLGIGIFVDDQPKRQKLTAARWLQPVRMRVSHGRVTEVGDAIGSKVAVSDADILNALGEALQVKVKRADMSRFF